VGVYAHATHVHLPDRDQGKVIAGALLKCPHDVVISPPYGKWINAYLPMGLSYKDVKELPTAPHVEVNVYDSTGLDIRLYSQDRLSFLFESGVGDDAAEQEDELLEIASQIWEKENPKAAAAAKSAVIPKGDGEGDAPPPSKADFWSLAEVEQNKYLAMARGSGEFRKFVETSSVEDSVPDVACFKPFMPEGRDIDELHLLLLGTSHRPYGPPQDERVRAAVVKWMGKEYSDKAEDYAGAIAKCLDLRGSLWSVDSILSQLSDKVDRRIVAIAALDAAPAPSTD